MYFFPSGMIVKDLDVTSTEKEIRQSFEYITHFPIVDVKLVKNTWGESKGYCFVQWKTVEVSALALNIDKLFND